MRKSIAFIKRLYSRCQDDSISALGAGFAYNLILAFFPFLIFLANIATYTSLVGNDVLNQLAEILPQQAYQVVVSTIDEIVDGNRANVLSISLLTALWAASNGFIAVMRGLNKAYDAKETRSFWITRGLSLLFTLLVALLILLNIILIVFGDVIIKWMDLRLNLPWLVMAASHIMRLVLPLLLIFLILLLLYRYIPNHRMPFRQLLPGAIFASLVWVAASLLFSFYITNFANYSLVYGSLGGVIILILWLYLSSTILLIGSEINATLTLDHKA